MSRTYHLRFRWGVSRGQDTYGYGICSLFVDGDKKASCNGGGYDMKGTSFGYWLADEFKDRLLKLDEEFYGLSYHDPDFDAGKVVIDGETIEEREAAGKSLGLERYQQFHKASNSTPTENHRVPLLDGACGFTSMERVLNAIGGRLKYISENSKETIYLLTIDDEEQANAA